MTFGPGPDQRKGQQSVAHLPRPRGLPCILLLWEFVGFITSAQWFRYLDTAFMLGGLKYWVWGWGYITRAYQSKRDCVLIFRVPFTFCSWIVHVRACNCVCVWMYHHCNVSPHANVSPQPLKGDYLLEAITVALLFTILSILATLDLAYNKWRMNRADWKVNLFFSSGLYKAEWEQIFDF